MSALATHVPGPWGHSPAVQGAEDPICQGGNARFRVAAGRGLDSGLRQAERAAARRCLASLYREVGSGPFSTAGTFS